MNDLQLEISSIHQEMGQVQNEIRIQEKQVVEEEKSVEKLELEALTKQVRISYEYPALLQLPAYLFSPQGENSKLRILILT